MTFLETDEGKPSKAVHIYATILLTVAALGTGVLAILSITWARQWVLALVVGAMAVGFAFLLYEEFRAYRRRLAKWRRYGPWPFA